MTVWVNGAFGGDDASAPARDRGFLLGDGAFETIYVENGVGAFVNEHLSRLRHGLGLMKIEAPAALDMIPNIIAELYRRDGCKGPAVARVTVTRGVGPRGLKLSAVGAPSMMVFLSTLTQTPQASILLHISTRKRFTGAASNAFKATGGYLQNMLAHQEALDLGADEALMLNEHGQLASAAAANVFIFSEGRLATPSLDEGAMPGVVRKVLQEESARKGLALEERPISPEELKGAEIVLTNSLIGVAPARLMGALEAGREMTALLQSCYQRRLVAEFAGK